MATEDDKTNTGVAGTAIAVGVAAMIAGSFALVGMARTEVDQVSQNTQAYANLNSINELKSSQAAKLGSAKVSIDKARQMTLSMLKGDPEQASPWTPKSVPVSTAGAGTDVAPSSGAEVTGPTGTAPTGSVVGQVEEQAAPAPSAEPSVAPAAPAPSAPGSN